MFGFKPKEDVDNTLYIITAVFNPRLFKSRYKLYREFKKYLESEKNVKLLTVEIAYAERPFEVTSKKNKWDLQLRSYNELWHKERAINIGFEYLLKLVPHAKYIAWIDADVKFTNSNWVRDTINGLHTYDIVQPFSEAINLNAKYEYMWHTHSSMKNFHEKLGYHQYPPLPLSYLCGGHPGLAWAARVSTFRKMGRLMDFCIAGSGDTHMLNALMGDVTLFYRKGMTEEYRQSLQDWADRAAFISRNIGYVDGICYHYWHGRSENRGYEKRWDILNFHQFNPKVDITVDTNGLYKWAGNKPLLAQDLRKSMGERDEDAIY